MKRAGGRRYAASAVSPDRCPEQVLALRITPLSAGRTTRVHDRPVRCTAQKGSSRQSAPPPTVSKIVSTNRVDVGGLQWIPEEHGFTRKPRDSRSLATKDERHRLVTKCHQPRFETSRAYKKRGERNK
jgi:hypothetical protein